MLFIKKIPSDKLLVDFWLLIVNMFNDINNMVRDNNKTKEKIEKVLNPIYALLEKTLKYRKGFDLLFGLKENKIDMKLVHYNDKYLIKCFNRIEELIPNDLKEKLSLSITLDREIKNIEFL